MILISDVLNSLGYQVLAAKDGEEGIQSARSEKPDLILMDLSLPRVDGWTATRTIRNDPGLARTPIIALTAHAMMGDRERALEAGCNDYLSKPINMRDLTAKLRQYLG